MLQAITIGARIGLIAYTALKTFDFLSVDLPNAIDKSASYLNSGKEYLQSRFKKAA